MKRKLKCYISAPANFDLTKIEQILDLQGIDHVSFYDFSIGTTFADLIRRKIRECDFTIAVLQTENSNVIFELGVAEGLRKPTFILVDKDLQVPFFLQRKLFYQTNFKDLLLIELALSNFTNDIGTKNKANLGVRREDILSIDETTDTLIKLNRLRRNPNELEIFELLKEVFSKIDIQNVSLSEAKDGRVDFIIRSTNLTPYFGSPILVEIKAGNLTNQIVIEAENNLLKYIQKTEAKGGIFLYLDRDSKRFDNLRTSYNSILFFDLEDFVNGIASEGFEKLMIDKRNKAAHGNF